MFVPILVCEQQVTALLPILSLAYMALSKNRHVLGPAWATLLKATGADEVAFGRDITQARTGGPGLAGLLRAACGCGFGRWAGQQGKGHSPAVRGKACPAAVQLSAAWRLRTAAGVCLTRVCVFGTQGLKTLPLPRGLGGLGLGPRAPSGGGSLRPQPSN